MWSVSSHSQKRNKSKKLNSGTPPPFFLSYLVLEGEAEGRIKGGKQNPQSGKDHLQHMSPCLALTATIKNQEYFCRKNSISVSVCETWSLCVSIAVLELIL